MLQRNMLHFTDLPITLGTCSDKPISAWFHKNGAHEQLTFPTLLSPTFLDFIILNQTSISVLNLQKFSNVYKI